MFSAMLSLFALLPQGALAQDPAVDPASRGMVRDVSEVVETAGGRWALIIGVEAYDDRRILPLQFAVDDAEGLAEALIAGGAFQPENVIVLSSGAKDPELQPTRKNVLLQLERLKRVKQADLVVTFFSGHGLGASDGSQRQNFLLPQDADVEIPQQTGISVESVLKTLAEVDAARRWVVLDACRDQLRSDARGALPETFSDATYSNSEGIQVLYCTRFGDVSWEDPSSGHGACTGVLLDGLAGHADGQLGGSQDGVVSSREIAAWMERALPSKTIGATPQHPFVTGDSTGDFALAAAVLPAPPEVVPRPGAPLIDATLAAGLRYTLDAHRGGERVSFLAAQRSILLVLPSLEEPARGETAADLHRMQLIYAATVQDTRGAFGELRAVATLAPGRAPLDGLEPVPALVSALRVPEEPEPLSPRESLPRGVSLLVDGHKAKARPSERPALVQAINCGSGDVQWSRWLEPGAALPSTVSPDMALCRRPTEIGLLSGAAGSFVLSGVALGVNRLAYSRWREMLEDYSEDAPPPEDVIADAEREARLMNLSVFASTGLAVAGVGLGAGWVVVKW